MLVVEVVIGVGASPVIKMCCPYVYPIYRSTKHNNPRNLNKAALSQHLVVAFSALHF